MTLPRACDPTQGLFVTLAIGFVWQVQYLWSFRGVACHTTHGLHGFVWQVPYFQGFQRVAVACDPGACLWPLLWVFYGRCPSSDASDPWPYLSLFCPRCIISDANAPTPPLNPSPPQSNPKRSPSYILLRHQGLPPPQSPPNPRPPRVWPSRMRAVLQCLALPPPARSPDNVFDFAVWLEILSDLSIIQSFGPDPKCSEVGALSSQWRKRGILVTSFRFSHSMIQWPFQLGSVTSFDSDFLLRRKQNSWPESLKDISCVACFPSFPPLIAQLESARNFGLTTDRRSTPIDFT